MSLPPLDIDGKNSWHKKWTVKEFLKACWPAFPIFALFFTFGGYYKVIKVTKMTSNEAIIFIPLIIIFFVLIFSTL